jgi:tRNA 2-selenouridine synthase
MRIKEVLKTPMVQEINIIDYFKTNSPLIDVRSPGEYEKGHIPGAVNIPLFSDAERADVGTVYVQQSKEKAMELGYEYVTPKLADFITESKKVAQNGKVVVHCWRGGMRSRSFAQHLHDNGFTDVSVIIGGYKAYRTHLHSIFDIPFNLRIVSGYTGSGKTLIIKQLQNMGLQAVDLEGLAKHKGSAFGAVAQQVQPTVEQFENNLFEVWRKLDYTKPIWLEDESHNIGGVNIPMNLFHQMRNCPAYFLDIPKEERARYLVTEYAEADPEFLAESIRKISKRLDGQKTKEAFQYLNENNFYEVAFIALSYYDKTYLKGMKFRDPEKVFIIPKTDTDPVENTKSILKLYEQHE